MSEQENKGTTLINKLVERILAVIKQDDQGRTETFINKTDKYLGREVKTYNSALVNLKHNYENGLLLLEEELEDLEVAYEETYMAITMEDIKNNEAANSFRLEYLSSIRKGRTLLLRKKDEIKAYTEVYEDEKSSIQEDIDLRNEISEKLKGN